ncbi:glycosyltransferase [Christiangramia sediminis]|uniref:Glycosyltransferase n=1 Tax=Christiangramia sediminis TaxID=2881336 RepID=A0A9X1LHR6_9FLAO|nr:glycosyltransferase [Christiangramia sediminis]MCB7480612.1 glycosyltransferase [Christiangramia sediminis]
MSKIKVLHIIKSLGRGGAETLLPETLKIHSQSEFEFFYIYFLPWKDQLVDDIEKAGGKVICLDAKNNIELILKYREIIDFCKVNKIDLIHCHLPWAGFVGRIVHFKTKIPVLYTEHNMQERYHLATKLLNKISFNFQNIAFGVSQEVTKSIIENIKPNIKVETLLNGVNTNHYKPGNESNIRQELGIPENAILIGNVAVFRFQKRLVEWLRVMSDIVKANPNVFGVIVGAGPLENEIRAEWEKLGLQENVFFTGLQTNVKPYFEAMDVFMMTSSFEGLPIAMLEAMSMECAIVATSAGGIKEVIRNNEDGIIVDVANWKSIPEHVNILINDHGILTNFKKAARLRVVNSFSLRNMVDELEKNYSEIVIN